MKRHLYFQNMNYPIIKLYAITFLFFILLSPLAYAQTKTWTNADADNLWSNPNNWNPLGVPTSADSVEFDGTVSNTNCNIDINVDVNFFAILANYSGTITVTSPFVNMNLSGNFTQSGGIFDVSLATKMTVIGSFIMDLGSFTSTSNTLLVGGNFLQSGGTFIHNNGLLFMEGTGDKSVQAISPLFSLTSEVSTNLIIEEPEVILEGTGTFNAKVYTLNTGRIRAKGDIVFGISSDFTVDIIFNGSADQTITTSNSYFNGTNVFIDKPSGQVLLGSDFSFPPDVGFPSTIHMTNGILNTNGFTLRVRGNTSFNGGSSVSYVDGTVRKVAPLTSSFFPVGNGGKYAPLELNNIIGISTFGDGVVSVSYLNVAPNNTVLSGVLQKVSRKGYWDVLSGSSQIVSADVGLYWNDGTVEGINSLSDLKLVGFTTGTEWRDYNGTASGSIANGTISANITDFGQVKRFSFGSNIASLTDNPLGVQLGDACTTPVNLTIGDNNIGFDIRKEAGANGPDVSSTFCNSDIVNFETVKWASFVGDGSTVKVTYTKTNNPTSTFFLKAFTTSNCINFTEEVCTYNSDANVLSQSLNITTVAGKTYYFRIAPSKSSIYPFTGNISITQPIITLTADPIVPAGNIFSSTSQNIVYAVKLDNPNAGDVLNQIRFTTSGTYTSGEVSFFDIYLSNDAVFDSNDSYLGASSNASLGTGESILFSTFANIPPGTSYLFLSANMSSSVIEGNTIIINGLIASDFQFANNTSAGTFPLAAGGTQTFRLLTDDYCKGATEVEALSNFCNVSLNIPATYTDEGPVLTGACAGLTVFKDAWIRFGVANGVGMSLEYTSTNQNVSIALYEGSCGTLTQIACVNDLNGAGTETIDFFPSSNNDYRLRIMNIESNSEVLGSVCIRTQAQAPAGDLCKNAITVNVGDAATPFNITNNFRNVESFGVAGCTNESATLDGWRNFTANSNYTSVSYQNTSKNSAITVYTGTCGSLTEVACLDDVPTTGTEVLNLNTTIGTPYFIRILNVLDNNTMNGNIRVFNTPAFTPANLIASNIISTDFTLTWDPVINADSYSIDVATAVNFAAGTFVGTYNNLTEATNTINITGLTAGTTYYCRVRATNVGGTSANSAVLTVTTLPNIPVALIATDTTQTKFTANWEDVLGADSYRIDISTDNFASFVSGFNNRNVGLVSSFTVVGLTANTTYQYRVRASLNNIQSDNSNVITVTTLPNPPFATTVLAATNITDTGFRVNWNLAANATEYFLDVATNSSFTNFVNGFQDLNVGDVSNFDVIGLSAGTNYFFRVRASNTGGVSSNSNFLSVLTAPIAPMALAATNIASISFTANWNTSPTAEGYLLDVAEDDLFTIFVAGFSGLDVGNVINTTVTGLLPANDYFYRVRAYNNGGVAVSGMQNVIEVFTLSNAPVALAASNVLANGFTANWQSVPNAASYQIDISTDNLFVNFVAGYNNLNVGNVLTQDITSLQAGTTYYYRVRAVNPGGDASDNSNTIAQITLPDAPLALAANPIVGLSFTANWQASTGAEGYFIDVATDNLFTNFVPGYQDLDVGNVTSFQVTGLDFETNYFYRIRAVNDGGLGISANSNIISVTTTPDLPAAPLALAATLITSNSFTANWQAVPTATKYFVDISLSDVFANFVIQNQDVGNFTSFNFTGLTAGQTYYYRVRSFDAVGTSLNSNSIEVQLNVGAPTAVSASNLDIQPVNSSFQSNWNPVLGATSYRLDVSQNVNFVFGSFVAGFNDLDVGNATSFTITGLNANETYFYRVRAVNSSSTSANSNVIEVNLVSNNSGIPTAPSGLSLFALSESAVEVSWTDNSNNETLFELQRSLQFIGGYTTIHNANANPSTGRITYIDEDNGNGLLPKTKYFYRVRAVGDFGNSAFTPRDSVTTLSGASVAPTNLEATVQSNTEIHLTWADNSNNEDGFYLYRATEETDFALIANINANITEYQDSGLQNNTVYFYLITTYKGLAESGFSNLATATTAPVPISPNNLVATAIAKDKVILNWQDNSSDETLFLIEMASVFSDDIFQYLDIVATNQTSFTVNNLVANQVYRFRVAAVNLDGLSPYTRPDTAKTFIDANINLPNEPISLSAEPVSTIEISLRWQDNSTNEDVFIIERADSELGHFEEIDRVLRNTTNYSDVGLTSGQTYYYRIFASNGGGISISSDTVSAQAVCNIITVINTDIANNGTIACDTKEVLLNLNTNISVGRFQWFRNDVVIPDAILPSYIASQSGEYYCRIVAGDCDKSSATTSIIIRPSFGVDIDLVIDTLLNQNNFEEYIYRLEANLVGVSNYQWYYNFEPIAGATSEEYFPKESGTYYVVVTDQGCSATSNLISLTVTALEDNDFSKSLKLSPNPTDGILQLDLETNISGDYQINLLDQTGRRFVLKKGKKETAILKETLDLVNFAEGLYFIEIRLKNQVAVRKVIKY